MASVSTSTEQTQVAQATQATQVNAETTGRTREYTGGRRGGYRGGQRGGYRRSNQVEATSGETQEATTQATTQEATTGETQEAPARQTRGGYRGGYRGGQRGGYRGGYRGNNQVDATNGAVRTYASATRNTAQPETTAEQQQPQQPRQPQFELDTEKYRELNTSRLQDITTNDLLCVLMARGSDTQNPALYGGAKYLYLKLNRYLQQTPYTRRPNNFVRPTRETTGTQYRVYRKTKQEVSVDEPANTATETHVGTSGGVLEEV